MYIKNIIIARTAAGLLAAAAGCRVVPVDETGPVGWTRAYLVSPAPGSPAVLYLWVTNPTSHADTVTGARVADADSAQLHGTMSMGNGMEHMVPLPAVALPARDTVRFAPGGRHVMVFGLGAKVAPGDSTAVTLTFRRAGEVQGWARVITYAQVDSLAGALALKPPGDRTTGPTPGCGALASPRRPSLPFVMGDGAHPQPPAGSADGSYAIVAREPYSCP